MRDLAKAYELLNKKLNIYVKLFCKYIPGQEVRVCSSRKTLEIGGNIGAIFRSESLRIFSVDFRLASHSFRQETPVNHRKKSENLPVGILLPFLIIFRTFRLGILFYIVLSYQMIELFFR